MNLVYKNEKKLFTIAAIVSALFWLILVVTTYGVALVYVLFGLLFYLFAQSGFISHLKGNGVKVSESQFPELYRSLTDCCQKVGMDTPPEMYLLRTDFFNALATISAGDTRWKDLNSSAYSTQIAVTSEFWMSFHELTNDYPWLTKRMSSALAFRQNQEIRHPRRSFFAGLLSIFVPRFGVGGGASLLVTVAMIGILAAIAIPAYQDYTIRAQISEGLNLSRGAQAAVTEFVQDRHEWPIDNASAGLAPASEISGQFVSGVRVEEGVIVVSYGNDAHTSIQGNSILIVPDASSLPTVSWDCYSSDIANKWLPAACRGN